MPTVAEGSRRSDIVVTCTPATRPILHLGDVADGAFIAAVGADSEHKQEIDVALMSRAAVVFDSTGTALEDVAAAALVYERAVAANIGSTFDFAS